MWQISSPPTASISRSWSMYTAPARAASPKPRKSKQWKALGPSWMPAPISPKRLACSRTMLRRPARARPRAVARPPMPPPAIRKGRSRMSDPPAGPGGTAPGPGQDAAGSAEEPLEAPTDDGLGLGHDPVDQLLHRGNVLDQAADHAAAPGGGIHVAFLQDLAVHAAGHQVADVV